MTIDIYLFDDQELISPQVQSNLPSNYIIRPLGSRDYERGHLQVLSELTLVGHDSSQDWLDQFYYMKKRNDTYFSLVIIDQSCNRVVAVGTLLIERKFVHYNGKVGHIEDIAVSGDQQGKKLGIRMIEALQYIGIKQNCYKIILDCALKNVPFYEKCGFTQKERQMAWYVPSMITFSEENHIETCNER
ncbi:acyl-CoA N-acyltransferase [Halteromyces radiatus]|uniref:acyl-CoA N-acyltransferase n=1 Tax=Halteromyces radiatus TaxID=101107 RepID=UPI00221F7F3C|nr:acyl-CoA N-acyltransferase [Halteromyces radiatus]KAI8099434.1 acyl-CoA N-acyltransferase [Halteromyces radiatus]